MAAPIGRQLRVQAGARAMVLLAFSHGLQLSFIRGQYSVTQARLTT
jgi:hypothetical protein